MTQTSIVSGRGNQRGMSLAEVLVAVAIFAVIFIGALMIYDRSNRVFSSSVESADLQQNTRIAFDKMLTDIRMAGYDYDRDGVPTAAGQAQQADEQIEYAGTRAITIRANLDHDEPNTFRGRESDLELPASQFPIVTTGNDEIVTYALVSESGTNPDTITFYADVTDGTDPTRDTFPTGEVEDLVEIAGVDLCASGTCDEPPYTLMRITLDGAGEPVFTPLANNIRSMEIGYFSDASGTTPLVVADAGGGQYNPANAAASQAVRAVRSTIRATNIIVVGMTDAPDMQYLDPEETIADWNQYRKYRLETLVVSRNLGKRGLREQQTAPPGPPTLDLGCFGVCGGVTLSWTAPPNTPGFGSVESYVVLWDTDVAAIDPPINPQHVGLGTSYTLPGLDPSVEYRFTVAATNSWGTTYSGQFVVGSPLNTTTPMPPSGLTASLGAGALPNAIELTWTLPTENVSGQDTLACETPAGVASTSAPVPPTASETRTIEIHRSTDMNFAPSAATLVGETTGSTGGFLDTTAANCTTYYYRIRLVEHCNTDPATQNTPPALAYSTYFPDPGDPGIEGYAESNVQPSAPTGLTVLGSSSCTLLVCKVDLEWPMVTTDVDGSPIAVETYVVEVLQDGAAYAGSPYTAIPSAGLGLAGGVATYTVAGLPELNLATAAPYEYTFTVKAVQCGLESDPSPEDKFPKCAFDGTPVVTMGAALAGNGSIGAPFELEGTSSISFSTSTSGALTSVSAIAYNSDNSEFADLGSAGPGVTLNLAWPGGSDSEVYRVDYTIIDASACQRTGSIYIEDVQVGCPFTVPVVISANLTSRAITIPILNASDFVIDIRRVEFNWDEDVAKTANNRDANISSVTFPAASGTGTVNAALSGDITDDDGGTAIATINASDANLVSNDQTGNYKMIVNFTIGGGPAGQALDGDPISNADTFNENITIFYRLLTDPVGATLRSCIVFP